MIRLAQPLIGEEEKVAVQEVMDSGMLAAGEVVNDFENAFSRYVNSDYAVATSSGTTALETALRAAGIKEGDKVVTTPFSFIASANAILYVGAQPLFADIDPYTFNMSPEDLERVLKQNEDIKAILIVHLYGQCCDMGKICELASCYDVLLIEDASQAHGAMWNGKKAGSFGDVATFSFYATKNMTTAEGGMVTTSCEDIYRKAKILINQGMSIRYHHELIGYNYRMTNIEAAIGLCQLKKLDMFNARRREIAHLYNEQLKQVLDIGLPFTHLEAFHIYHHYTLKVRGGKREKLMQFLNTKGIGSCIYYPLTLPEQKCYSHLDFPKFYSVADQIKKEVLSIPVHPALKDCEVKYITECLIEFGVEQKVATTQKKTTDLSPSQVA
ncbi:aminotransferase DegT [Chitinispirillum alkaliphilum]|nr:aminotransferase DegT [Chitinispirillum alkaliphilum]